MTVRKARLTMGLAAGLALIGTAVPATAADWYSGGIKDYGGAGGVPVPAPAPIPVHETEWYIGVVAGGVLVDDSTVENIGSAMPVRENLNKTLFGGISAGTYLTPNIRAEFAFDFYDDFKVAGSDPVTYSQSWSGEGQYIQNYQVTRSDTIKVGRTTAMYNMYYDIPTGTRLRPFVGAGIGVTWRSMKRNWREEADCESTTDTGQDPILTSSPCHHLVADDPDSVVDQPQPQHWERSGTVETDRFDLALAAMAGVSYEITPDIIWDNSYQFLWESAGISLSTETFSGTSTVSYSDTTQHQFRTGLRFNIN